jgi:hypothetical protein
VVRVSADGHAKLRPKTAFVDLYRPRLLERVEVTWRKPEDGAGIKRAD